MAPNLQSGASLSQIKEKPSQQLDPDSEIGDQSTAVSGSAGEEVRKAASDADTDKLSQDKAITLRSTTRKSEVDASSEAHPTDLSQNHQTLAHSKRNDGEKKPLSCPHCEKTYTRINQLNAHKRIHMRGSKLYKDNNGSTDGAKGKGRKVHKCPICHALFYNYKKFCGHRGAHIAHKTTQFRKYNMASQESNCKESSQSKPKVLEPKVTDSTSAGGSKKLAGKFTCKFCPETFQNVAQLRNHILVTHPMTKGKPFLLKPFTCELCGKSFTKSKTATTPHEASWQKAPPPI
ncbi:zinc finger protein 43-like [Strongylocentrotus purpuratus]|uniref:C2H2-type domain-containing protein n=1 Tax=Strongylocentrotus purpuratus TaxID=7668 RepID=A0A7M7T5F0_STRPU|nr:zinc finger protein 43-like [Strongylocentrotus purpuratus]